MIKREDDKKEAGILCLIFIVRNIKERKHISEESAVHRSKGRSSKFYPKRAIAFPRKMERKMLKEGDLAFGGVKLANANFAIGTVHPMAQKPREFLCRLQMGEKGVKILWGNTLKGAIILKAK